MKGLQEKASQNLSIGKKGGGRGLTPANLTAPILETPLLRIILNQADLSEMGSNWHLVQKQADLSEIDSNNHLMQTQEGRAGGRSDCML